MTKCLREKIYGRKIYLGSWFRSLSSVCEEGAVEWLGPWWWEGVAEAGCSHDDRLGSREQD